MTDHLAQLSDLGVSIWLDDLSRERLEGGGAQSLSSLITDDHVVGVTTNPSIFASALSEGTRYDADLARLAGDGTDVPTAITSLTTADVRTACDRFTEIHERTDGVDGRVSIEVDPYLAHDTDGTLAQARELWRLVDRRNLLVKIPATAEGLPAITAATAEGISVNVTLIFSLDRYRAVARAFTDGLERAQLAASEGVHAPRFAYDAVIQQSRAVITGAPFGGGGDSPLFADAKSKVAGLVPLFRCASPTA